MVVDLYPNDLHNSKKYNIYLEGVAIGLILLLMEIRGSVDYKNNKSPWIHHFKNGFSTHNSPLVIFSLCNKEWTPSSQPFDPS
jgi:hypothetical protein